MHPVPPCRRVLQSPQVSIRALVLVAGVLGCGRLLCLSLSACLQSGRWSLAFHTLFVKAVMPARIFLGQRSYPHFFPGIFSAVDICPALPLCWAPDFPVSRPSSGWRPSFRKPRLCHLRPDLIRSLQTRRLAHANLSPRSAHVTQVTLRETGDASTHTRLRLVNGSISQ